MNFKSVFLCVCVQENSTSLKYLWHLFLQTNPLKSNCSKAGPLIRQYCQSSRTGPRPHQFKIGAWAPAEQEAWLYCLIVDADPLLTPHPAAALPTALQVLSHVPLPSAAWASLCVHFPHSATCFPPLLRAHRGMF